jgi:hypothetical protein
MRKTNTLRMLLAAGAVITTATAFAGPGPKSPIASLSRNGHVLVTCEMTFDGNDETQPRKVTSSIFAVHTQPLREANDGLRVNGPNTYWDYQPLLTTWSVHLPFAGSPGIVGCPYMLVTDDGEYLLLLQSYALKGAILLFRRRDHPGEPRVDRSYNLGVLVREIPVDEVDPPPTTVLGRTMTDHTPQWYSHGTFSFSLDNRTLLYNKGSGSVQIDLATGVVTRMPVPSAKP